LAPHARTTPHARGSAAPLARSIQAACVVPPCRIDADQNSGSAIAWRKTRASPYTPTPLVYGNHLYICNDNGVLTVYDAASGAQIYVHRIGGGHNTFSASPVAAGGRVYFSSEDGDVFVIKAGPVYEGCDADDYASA
jgi:outer membrane protein assembly factor BamB